MDYAILSTMRNSVRIDLESNITILGGASGSGKTESIALASESDVDIAKQLKVISNLPCYPLLDDAAESIWSKLVESIETVLFYIDEELALQKWSEIILSKHKYLIICRSRSLYNYADMRNFYRYNLHEDFYLECTKIVLNTKLEGKPDAVFVESAPDKNEHLYFNTCLPEIVNVIPGNGRNHMCKVIRGKLRNNKKLKKIFVALDAGAGLSSLEDLVEDCRVYGVDIRLIEYTAFEAILYFSKLVQNLNRPRPEVLGKMSVEKYFEELIRVVTQGTKLYSDHPSIAQCFIKQCNDCCKYGEQSLLLKTLFNKEGLPLLKWYWNTYHPEWVPLTDDIIDGLKRTYNPNGF